MHHGFLVAYGSGLSFMSGVKVISLSSPDYFRILPFLFPSYAVSKNPASSSEFITYRDIKSKQDREYLDYDYADCVFISRQIFDEVWDEDVIRREVLAFAQRVFGSRKRTLKTLATEGPDFIDECLAFIFTGVTFEDDESKFTELFDLYGSVKFIPRFIQECGNTSVGHVSASMDTFILRLLNSTDSPYYRRAKMRLESSLRPSITGAIEAMRTLDKFYTSKFRDLCQLWFYMNLLRRQYFK